MSRLRVPPTNHDVITVTALSNEKALVTFVGDTAPTHKIIVHDVLASALIDSNFLIRGARRS